ncbi:MAG TPA: L-seryl-tRNA(Sec) selenium transferase [Candidatus Acidoferrales bacterium]|nr:L-seryl-tRNA(Sec) selenium transferase [Candidatus Acidoferrales bacterium]
MTESRLRSLPAIEKLLRTPALADALRVLPRVLVLEAARAELAATREALRASRAAVPGPDLLAERAALRARTAARPQLVRVLNATGVVLHTNLGRAPLAEEARRAIAEVAAGYSSLEYDLASGKRGDRGLGIERWLVRLTGAEAAAVVNNGAAALLLALSAVAGGRKVIVSRGELVEIGGSFRVPDIMEKGGATLVEVGTTNRTHLRDYERALDRHDDVAAILRVHRSNFRLQGFTTSPEPRELADLAHRHRIVFLEDLGSGALVDLAPFGLEHEPTVAESLAAGCDLVTFSGDKLLGGSQAGLLLGRRRWVERAKRDPLARALRLDKLALAALEATLPLYADPALAAQRIPVLAALRVSGPALAERAARLAAELTARVPALQVRVVAGHGDVGGGALPLQKLAGPVVEVAHPALAAAELERRARGAQPPVLGMVRANRFRLDPRTLTETEVAMAATALGRAWESPAPDTR